MEYSFAVFHYFHLSNIEVLSHRWWWRWWTTSAIVAAQRCIWEHVCIFRFNVLLVTVHGSLIHVFPLNPLQPHKVHLCSFGAWCVWITGVIGSDPSSTTCTCFHHMLTNHDAAVTKEMSPKHGTHSLTATVRTPLSHLLACEYSSLHHANVTLTSTLLSGA